MCSPQSESQSEDFQTQGRGTVLEISRRFSFAHLHIMLEKPPPATCPRSPARVPTTRMMACVSRPFDGVCVSPLPIPCGL